ncbi:flavin monoamine oxidase family protein [Salibacterium aidingense]|uniref:flavin monoamine oxidase family protein n=1 Tax=Salibacterium aidingense TaxID=384933 RepID=UPI003BD6B0F3
MSQKLFAKDVTRRQFLNDLGKVGGTVAVFGAMESLGLLASTPAKAAGNNFPDEGDLSAIEKNGKKVIILGAGLAGMSAAYELTKSGYECTILEARERSGGRNWSIRGGTQSSEIDKDGQTSNFDDGLYLNAGPARIPQHHTTTMGYCRELGVKLEPFSNINEAAYMYNEGVGRMSGSRIRRREVRTDIRGYTSELLAKALDQDALDQPLTNEDQERLLSYLQQNGGLDDNLTYKGTSSRGYSTLPGVGSGSHNDPFDFSALLESQYAMNFSGEYSINQQPMMFQPVGGMDQIPKAFEEKVGYMITFQAEVQEIRQTEDRCRVVYKKASGKTTEVEGDFCICTIPLPVLKDIPADFSKEMTEAVGAINYASTGKIGLQFKRRFWEEDDHIYGGITDTNQDITQIWYPSSDYLSQKGILVGYYNFGGSAEKFGNYSFKNREKYALEQGSKIHPQYFEDFENSFSVAWHKVKYNLGGWASYSQSDRDTSYQVLKKPDGRIYLAGEHISYYTGWMAGAFESMETVVEAIHNRVIENEPLTSRRSAEKQEALIG